MPKPDVRDILPSQFEPVPKPLDQIWIPAVHMCDACSTLAAAKRLEFLLPDESKEKMERTAKIECATPSDCVATTADERDETILREATVPASFFDDLVAALEAPTQANKNLAKVVQSGARALPTNPGTHGSDEM